MNWAPAALKIVVLVGLSGLLGLYYGRPLAAVVISLLALVAFWLYQLHRLKAWLDNPQQPPPDVYGIWGDLMAQIYLLQRNSKATQERLQATVQYLRDSLASIRDGVILVDSQGAIDWFNEAAESLLDLRFPQDQRQTLTNLVRAPEFNKYFVQGNYDEPLQYLTGLDFPSHLRVEITHFGEGQRLLFVRDVSKSVRDEQIRRDFVGNVSHEMRTPLTVISGYLGTLLSDPGSLPAPHAKALEQMSQQAQRLENLLKDLLWLSRIEGEHRQIEQELLDVKALVNELREEMAEIYPEREIQVKWDGQLRVLGDYRELYSAVHNLLLNAIKYSPADTPVQIHGFQQDSEFHLAIRDHGIGIDSMHFARLTERFYRVDDSRCSELGGTGLGLAIVKHVAAAHGARLQIESELGEGSTFTLIFAQRESR